MRDPLVAWFKNFEWFRKWFKQFMNCSIWAIQSWMRPWELKRFNFRISSPDISVIMKELQLQLLYFWISLARESEKVHHIVMITMNCVNIYVWNNWYKKIGAIEGQIPLELGCNSFIVYFHNKSFIILAGMRLVSECEDEEGEKWKARQRIWLIIVQKSYI